MVWSSEVAADEANLVVAPVARNHLLVGHRAGRVLVPDSRQPNRIYRQRRPLHADATQSDAGGYNTDNLYIVHHNILPWRVAAMEPLCRLRMLDSGRIFRFYEVIST